MLSRKAVWILRFMRHSGQWLYRLQIEKQIQGFDDSAFQALLEGGYLCHAVMENEIPEYNEYGQIIYPEQYRIADKGLAYLETLSRQRWVDVRSWAAFLISVAALLVSILK